MTNRKEKAIDIMSDRLELIHDVSEGIDFVEVTGEDRGDVERFQIYFDKDDSVVSIFKILMNQQQKKIGGN